MSGFLLSLPGKAIDFLGNHRDDIVKEAATYLIVLWIVGAVIVALVSFGIIIGSCFITGTCFLIAIGLFLIVWFPHGLILRLVQINDQVFPIGARMFVAWLSFFAFLGVIYPEVLTVKVMLIVVFLSIIMFASASKINVVDKIMIPLVIGLCLVASWKWASPDSFRATARHMITRGMEFNSWQDRTSIEGEANALATYARPNRDVKVLYVPIFGEDEDGNKVIKSLSDVMVYLHPDILVKVYNHKNEVMSYQGQGFVEIQLPKETGSFVDGRHYWIEADYIDVVSPSELKEELAQSRQSVIQNSSSSRMIPVKVSEVVLGPGEYKYSLKAGEETPVISFQSCGKWHYSISSKTYNHDIVFSDTTYHDSPSLIIPERLDPKFKIRALVAEVVTVKVTAKS